MLEEEESKFVVQRFASNELHYQIYQPSSSSSLVPIMPLVLAEI